MLAIISLSIKTKHTKKTMQGCMSFSSQKGQNHAKSACFFLPDEKTHAKVNGFEHPYQKKNQKVQERKENM